MLLLQTGQFQLVDPSVGGPLPVYQVPTQSAITAFDLNASNSMMAFGDASCKHQ